MADEKYQEIFRLVGMLTAKGIPHELLECHDGWQILYPKSGRSTVCSVVEHHFSYCSNEDKLEILGLLTKEERFMGAVKGWLTAEDVYGRIARDWKTRKSKWRG